MSGPIGRSRRGKADMSTQGHFTECKRVTHAVGLEDKKQESSSRPVISELDSTRT